LSIDKTPQLDGFESNQIEDSIAMVRKVLDQIDVLQIQEQLKFKQELLRGISNGGEVEGKIQNYLLLSSNLNKYFSKLTQRYSAIVKEDLKNKIKITNGVNTLVAKVSGLDADSMKSIALQLRKEIESVFIVLGGEYKGKVLLAMVISDDLISSRSLNAAEIIREIAPEINGGGGGQPFFATAGGSNVNGIPVAFKKALSFL